MSADAEIIEFIKSTYPEAQLEVKQFPSGGFCIDLRLHGAFVTIQYSAADGFGVSRIESGDLEFSGHDDVFSRAAEVINHLRSVLS